MSRKKRSSLGLLMVLVLAGLGLAQVNTLKGFGFWLEAPNRSNPNDPKSKFFVNPFPTNTPVPPATPTPPYTATPTPSDTPFQTPTTTPTASPFYSSTPTPSPTPTTTVGPCSTSANFSFEDGTTGGFSAGGTGSALANSTAEAGCGTHSMVMSVAAVPANDGAEADYTMAGVMDYTGKTVSFWYKAVGPALPLRAPDVNHASAWQEVDAQIVFFDGGGSFLKGVAWTTSATIGNWTYVSYTVVGGDNLTNVGKVALQVFFGGTWSGSLYYDQVELSGTPCDFPADFTFEDGSTGGFAVGGTGSNLRNASSPVLCGAHSLGLDVAAVPANDGAEVDLDMIPTVNMSGKTVTFYYLAQGPALPMRAPDASHPSPWQEADAQIVFFSSGGAYLAGFAWTTASTIGNWVKVSYTVSAGDLATTPGLASTGKVALKVFFGGTWNGQLYYDQVSSPGGPCGAAASAEFEDGLTDGFLVGSSASNVRNSASKAVCGTRSLACDVAATPSADGADADYAYPSPVNLTGRTVSFWYYAQGPALPMRAPDVGHASPWQEADAQIVFFDSGGAYLAGFAWTTSASIGNWVLVSYTVSAADVAATPGLASAGSVSYKVFFGGTWNGTLYYDHVNY